MKYVVETIPLYKGIVFFVTKSKNNTENFEK